MLMHVGRWYKDADRSAGESNGLIRLLLEDL